MEKDASVLRTEKSYDKGRSENFCLAYSKTKWQRKIRVSMTCLEKDIPVSMACLQEGIMSSGTKLWTKTTSLCRSLSLSILLSLSLSSPSLYHIIIENKST
jgi:hypothetical protein